MSNATDNPRIEVLKAGGSGVFTNYIYKAIPLAFDESMSYYETLAGLRDYLEETVIPTVNNNAEAVAELQGLYEELNAYVDNYFNNLDVQEEINNKLDDLVEDGTLTRLIGEYVQPLIDEQNQEISEFKTQVNGQIAQQNTQIQAVTSGSPLVASSVQGMTDTTRVYVNTTDGNWYYYNGTQWVIGGVYQATALDSETDETIKKNSTDLSQLLYDTYKINSSNFKKGYTIQNITDYSLEVNYTGSNYYVTSVEPIDVISGDKFLISQSEEHPFIFKVYIKQENGIILQEYNWKNVSEYLIPASGKMYITIQNSTPTITEEMVYSAFTFLRKSDIVKLRENDLDLNNYNFMQEYFRRKMSSVTWNTNLATYFAINTNTATAVNSYLTVPIKLPFDLKISFKDLTWGYQFLVEEWSSNITTSETLLHNFGPQTSGKDLILPKNRYWTFGIRKSNAQASNFIDVINLLKFEKIEPKIIPDEYKSLKSINHRGYGTAPENTIIAYKKSIINGFKYIETDLRKTSDGKFVLLHDPTINRVARNSDGTEISTTINIADITYEQALQYDFGIYKGQEYAGTKIGTLEDLLRLCRDLDINICLELESGAIDGNDIEPIIDLLKSYNMREKTLIMSANAGLMRYVPYIDPYVKVGYVIFTTIETNEIKDAYNTYKTPYNEVYFILNKDYYQGAIEEIKSYNAHIIVWTINTEEGIINVDPFVEGIESDTLVAENVLRNYQLGNLSN